MSATDIIGTCIRACVNAQDGRGRWRPANTCAAELEAIGTQPGTAACTALAAARFGAWLHDAADQAMQADGAVLGSAFNGDG